MPRSLFDVSLLAEERRTLEFMARKHASPYSDVFRAKIILLASEGLANDVINDHEAGLLVILQLLIPAPFGQDVWL